MLRELVGSLLIEIGTRLVGEPPEPPPAIANPAGDDDADPSPTPPATLTPEGFEQLVRPGAGRLDPQARKLAYLRKHGVSGT
jgi:hypothetical protein